ncbi:hypothetical protein DA798_08580, partial [Lactobacillus sp. PFC-70]
MGVMEKKTHFKMYKSHKGWLVAGITATSLAVGLVVGPQAEQTAQASDAAPATESISEGNDVEQGSSATLRSTTESQPSNGTSENGTASETPGSVATKTDIQENPVTDSTVTEKTASDVETDNLKESDGATNQDTTTDKVQAADPNTVSKTASDGDDSQAQLSQRATAKAGIDVQDPSNLTDPVKGKTDFNISSSSQLQNTYDHTDQTGRSSDLRVHDGYSPYYQTQGQMAWAGETYAKNIALDAKGIDPDSPAIYLDGSHVAYIDEWMPDQGLQYFLWLNNFSSEYASAADFRANFTKADLAKLTNISTTQSSQQVDAQYNPSLIYQMLMSMKTLEGLQYAQNLETLYLYPNVMVSQKVYGTAMKNGNLWDIRALNDLQNLKQVDITLFSVNDISALGNKPQLTHVGLSHNQVSDISPLATDPNLDVKSNANLSNQHVTLAPITLNDQLTEGKNQVADGTVTYTTPSFIIKDLGAENLPIRGFNNDEQALYPLLYPSTADAGNVNMNTLTWYNLKANPSGKYGNLSTTWQDPNSDFGGYIIQPYALSDEVTNVTVSFNLLQADGQQLSLGPMTTLSGKVGDQVNIQANPTVQTLIGQQQAKGNQYLIALDGTGLYSDYLAGNGLANPVSLKPTLTDKDLNVTLLFYKDVTPWNVNVMYGYLNNDGTVTQITDEEGKPVTQEFATTSDQKIATSGLVKDFPDYVYKVAYSSTDGQHLDADITEELNVPFLTLKQPVMMIYAAAKRATVTIKDAVTGETLKTLDYTTTPELRGEIGSTSTFDSDTEVAPELAKGYVVLQDTTKKADGTSAIVFNSTDPASTDYTITLGHAYVTTDQQVTETITYQDKSGTVVATPVTNTMTFATVTDQVTQDAKTYSAVNVAGDPTLDVQGVPTDAAWQAYPDGTTVTFKAVVNPTVKGMHVIKTTDSANDLTQTTAQNVTPTSQNLAFVVTYGHDFDTVLKQVKENITYVDQSGQQVATPVDKTITFATVTDQSNQQSVIYSYIGDAQTPGLDENGVPTDANWAVYQAGQPVTFVAVTNPAVKGMHVVKTTDPANDLTQTTAQAVTNASQNLAIVVTYAHDFETTLKHVTENITYVDQSGQQVATPVDKTITFATVTDQSNQKGSVKNL